MPLKKIAPYQNIYQASPGTRLIYGTDMEGDLSALVAFVFNSQRLRPGLRINLPNPKALDTCDLETLRLDIDSNCHFVFGGDATDHGLYNVTVLRLLVDLKTRHPQQVTLIAGNRDINKIRIKQEINPAFIDAIYAQGERKIEPHWLPEERRVPFATYVKEHLPESIAQAIGPWEDWSRLPEKSKKLLYLHWMLAKTLNSPHSFKRRAQELSMRGLESDPFAVLDNFMGEELDWHLAYMQRANLGIVVNNITIVHGGLTPQTFIVTLLSAKQSGKHYPYTDYLPGALLMMDYQDWMRASEALREQAVCKFLSHAQRLPTHACRQMRNTVFQELDRQFHEALEKEYRPLDPQKDVDCMDGTLLAQGEINRSALPTDSGLVCYNDVNKNGDKPLDLRWEDFLRRAGACENISGHIPQGDRGRMLSGRVRHVLLDTTYKQQLEGIPNEDILSLQFDSQGGHTLRMGNSQEEHIYPAMDCEGHFSEELLVQGSTLINLDKSLLPEKYQGNPRIENRPWCIGPRIEKEGQRHYLLTQKHGPDGQFKTHVIHVSEQTLSRLRNQHDKQD